MKRLYSAIALWLAAVALPMAVGDELPRPQQPLELRDGERVALVGGTFIERLQNFGYLETYLTAAFPERHICFRNLGWSGDTVWGEARAVFGSPHDGFQRLIKDLSQTQPTLLYVAYGANEAEAGEAGIENFKTGLKRLLDELAKIQPRIVLVSPLRRENLGSPLPDQREYNRNLKLYTDAVAAEAQARNLPFVNLFDLVGSDSGEIVDGAQQFTDNGVHLNPYGQWKLAPIIASRLTGSEAPSKNVIELDGAKALASGKVSITAKRLPYAALPAHSPEAATAAASSVVLRVGGLAEGQYQVRIDGKEALAASAAQLAEGVALTSDPNIEQESKLRRAIAAKNELFFHRHRPQNETYLFLFRRGEQGNNAVEIPQFDPLIEEKEKEIAALRAPQSHEFEIIRVK
jgi:lysophospholipase L1-like esterase